MALSYIAEDTGQPYFQSPMGNDCPDDVNEVHEETLIDYLRSVEVSLREDFVHRLNDALRYSCHILIELSTIPTVAGINLYGDSKQRTLPTGSEIHQKGRKCNMLA